ncbi:hypothetical protein BDR04DRAFT_1152136 [Suillus decipiens]|nr:hypothetical protein BDR04DRAFT_1152136 [Suillus decipiens]
MASLFDSAVVLSPMAESIQHAFTELQEKMAMEAKCIPNDKLNLAVEKEEWCHRWSNLTDEIEKCIKARQEKGVTLALTSEDVATGRQVAEWHNTFIAKGTEHQVALVPTIRTALSIHVHPMSI